MSRKTIDFDNENIKFFMANPRQLAGYQATIQNGTGQSLTVTVTNFDVSELDLSDGSIQYVTPSSGTLTIANGSIGLLLNPYQAWKLTLAASATGQINITEMG